jgi:hypothetical protein
MRNYNAKIFFVTLFIICIISFLSLLASMAEPEGTSGNNIVSVIFAKLFYVFRLPVLALFPVFTKAGIGGFIAGLFLNCICYGFLLERMIAWNKEV